MIRKEQQRGLKVYSGVREREEAPEIEKMSGETVGETQRREITG